MLRMTTPPRGSEPNFRCRCYGHYVDVEEMEDFPLALATLTMPRDSEANSGCQRDDDSGDINMFYRDNGDGNRQVRSSSDLSSLWGDVKDSLQTTISLSTSDRPVDKHLRL